VNDCLKVSDRVECWTVANPIKYINRELNESSNEGIGAWEKRGSPL
jgi:hypothetical protein